MNHSTVWILHPDRTDRRAGPGRDWLMQGLTGSSWQGSFIPEARGRRDLNGISKQSRFKGEVARPEGIVSLMSWPGFDGVAFLNAPGADPMERADSSPSASVSLCGLLKETRLTPSTPLRV